jgi:hypothetical protein
MQMENLIIDAVIAWVDGNDPFHEKKIQDYLKPEDRQADDIAGSTRYASVGEIFFLCGFGSPLCSFLA